VKLRSTLLLQLVTVVIVIVVVVFPVLMFFVQSTLGNQHHFVPHESSGVLVRTAYWSVSVGLLATLIGWPTGLRISTLRQSRFAGVVIVLLMSLALPAYAVFYAWWQAWPAGSWLHQYVVQHGLLGFTMKTCVLAALVGWSWPIPALIAAMSNRERNSLLLLHQLDGTPIHMRFIQRLVFEKKMLAMTVIVVAALTAANTTCFDLAQISTVGNELRAVIASGGSITSAPLLSFSGIVVAIVASIVLLRCKNQHQQQTIQRQKSLLPIIIVWVALTGGPLVLSALTSISRDGFQLWAQYGGDLLMSTNIALCVVVISCLILLSSMSLHLSPSTQIRKLANGLDFVWIFVACLPASLIAYTVGHAWHLANLDFIDRTPIILVLAQATKIGFVGAIAGRWIAQCPRTLTLSQLDAPRTIGSLFRATQPRLLQAMFVTLAVSMAMSFGEIVLTSQLAPPSTHQPISVALLNAMHYQRPQIVTSALFLMVAIATVGGLCLFIVNRKFVLSFVVICLLASCRIQEEVPNLHAINVGSAGNTDGHFVTPRAIDSDSEVIVVIDKTGRLQRFSHDGIFLSSWDLELSGTGFPTGVSIDEDRNIWVADTHQHRILVLDSEGNVVLTFGEYGTGDGQFLYPTDIAFGVDGEVYVSEYGGNDRISVFDRSGLFLRSIGHHGEEQNGFRRPQSIAVDPNTGYLYVADSGNHRVVVLKPTGEVINSISEVGRQASQMLYPYGILIDSPNSFLVCEFGNNRLQRFSLDGVPIETWGSAGSDVGFLRTPWGVALTPKGIVVADTGNNRLQLLPDMMTTP